MANLSKFKDTLEKYGLSYEVSPARRIILLGDDENVRGHFQEIVNGFPELEAEMILEEAKVDVDLMYEIEERAAIRWADGLPGDLFSAVMCNF